MTARIRSLLPVIPIGAAVFFIVIANVVFIGFHLFLPYPHSPWEAGIVTDAWRMRQGESVYAAGANHATHMYGPLVTVLLAQAFRLTGPTLQVGRFLTAFCGIALVITLARIFGRGGRLAFGVAVALLLAANARTLNYFTETRPDLDSVFFGLLALIVLYRGLEERRTSPQLVLAGAALLVIAVLFKQTAAVFAFIPALSIAGRRGASSNRSRILAIVPLIGVLITFGVIRQFARGLWHFMVEVPAQYHVPPFRLAGDAVEFLVSVPLFSLALLNWLFTDASDTWQMPRARWLVAALICTIPASIAAFAKDGGAPNSLIPAILSIGVFCAWRAPAAYAFLRDISRPLPLRIVTGSLLGFMLVTHAYPVPGALSPAALKEGHGVNERSLVIAEVRSLPGKIVCPDDPTIPLMAKGYAGRTAMFEADAVYWSPKRVQAMVKEIDSADYVIAMRHGAPGNAVVTTPVDWANDSDFLRANGFTRSDFKTVSTPVYELWRRTGPPASRPIER